MPHFSKCFGDKQLLPSPYEITTCDKGSYQILTNKQKSARSNSFLPGKVMLFGRNEFINKIVFDLTQTNQRCVVLEGSPGCGKTAVAVAVGHDLIEKGIIVNFVDLRLVESHSDIMQAILTALHQGGSLGQNLPTGKIFEILQRTNEQRVLVLDNAEDCFKTEILKDQFIEVIKKITMVKDVDLIVTSRFGLRICEIQMERHHLSGISKEAAVSILTNKLPISILLAGELAHECGYIPLALQVITALTEEHVKPSHILKSIRRGKAMKILSPDFLSNKEKLVSCISTSYDSLQSELRCGFISLAVFPRSFCLCAASAVLGTTPEDARTRVLNPLTRRNLLEYEEMEERWKFHVLLRNFAFEMRENDKNVRHIVACKTYQHRFCSYFIKFIQEASRNFTSRTRHCIKQCEADLYNIQETLKMASDPVFVPEFSCLTDGALGIQVGDMFSCVLPVDDQIRFYQNCVVDSQRRGNLERECALLCRLATVYISSVNCTFTTLPDGPGNECLEKIVKIIENLDFENSIPLARCLADVGRLEAEMLDFGDAIKRMKTALAIQERNGDDIVATASTLTDIGNTEIAYSNLAEALFHLNKGHVLLENFCTKLEPFTRQANFQAFIALAKNKKCLGQLHLLRNMFEEALKMFQQADDICQLYTPDHPTRRFALDGIAHCYLKMKNYEKALEFYEKSLELRKDIVAVELPVNTKILSYVCFEMGLIDKAIQLEREVMSIWERSFQTNEQCMNLIREEQSKNYVATVFYALVLPHEKRDIEKFIFEKIPTVREVRIREFAHGMWSSETVAVMHLEPERYELASSYLRESYADKLVGEVNALDTRESDGDWDDVVTKASSLTGNGNSCLLIMRPMPPLGNQSLQLLPVVRNTKKQRRELKCINADTVERNKSKFCTIL